MSVVINTNVNSTKIQNILSKTTDRLSQTMLHMSTGLRINSAKDDAAGTVISAKMKVQLNGNKIAQNNVQNANAMLSTIEGNLDVIADNVSRIRDLTLQAKNGTYSTDEIAAMDEEVQKRISEINRVHASSTFSSISLFSNTSLQTNGTKFQVGSNPGTDNAIVASSSIFNSVLFSAISGLQNFTLKTLNAGTLAPVATNTGDQASSQTGDDNYDIAVRALDIAINNIANRKVEIGSAGNRLDSALSTLTTQYENLSSANSLITDADIASEASNYTQNQILQQISISLLAQANSTPSVALGLMQA